MIKRFCIVTSKYPNLFDPASLVFVQQFAWAIADLGIECTVICPIAFNIEIKKGKKLPYEDNETTPNGSIIKIYYPRYFGYGQRNLFFFNTAKLTLKNFYNSVQKVVNNFKERPDVIYGHFISPSGITAAKIGNMNNIPSFLAYGESSPWSIKNLGIKTVKKELINLTGVVSVSTKNKSDLVNMEIIEAKKIGIFPNSIRPSHFYPRDKMESRLRFGLPKDVFIISFVGHFITRKGIDKVIQALNDLENVYGIFAGKGPIVPSGDKVLYCGLTPPIDLPYFYSASDVFVLPTKNEGCCNAIIEAMACGIPIISSDKEFNYDILDNESAILIDPENQMEINQAIVKIKDDIEFKKSISEKSFQNSKRLHNNKRAENIINWMNKLI